MAENQQDTTTRASDDRDAKLGDVVDCKIGATVVDPRGNQRTMGADKYVLDQVGEHVVGKITYQVKA